MTRRFGCHRTVCPFVSEREPGKGDDDESLHRRRDRSGWQAPRAAPRFRKTRRLRHDSLRRQGRRPSGTGRRARRPRHPRPCGGGGRDRGGPARGDRPSGHGSRGHERPAPLRRGVRADRPPEDRGNRQPARGCHSLRRAPCRRPELHRLAVRQGRWAREDGGRPARPRSARSGAWGAGGHPPRRGACHRDPGPRGRCPSLRRLLRTGHEPDGRRSPPRGRPQAEVPRRRQGHRDLVVRPHRRCRHGDEGCDRGRRDRHLQRRRRRAGARVRVAPVPRRRDRCQAASARPRVGRGSRSASSGSR